MRPHDFPAKFPNALATLLINQLKKLERYNENRREIIQYYRKQLPKSTETLMPHADGAIYLRFSFLSPDPSQIVSEARRHGVYLGNWYHNVIDPTGVDYQAIGYAPGSCPKAENAARRVINLPTRVSLDDAKKVMEALGI